MADLEVRPEPGQDVVIIVPAGLRFDQKDPTTGLYLWRNSGHTRVRVKGAVQADPTHGHTVVVPPPEPEPEPEPPPAGKLPALTKAYLAGLPKSGAAYGAVLSAANNSARPDLSNQNSLGNTNALARAILGRSSEAAADFAAAEASLSKVGDTLCISRELATLPLVSNLAGRDDRAWLSQALNKSGLTSRGIGNGSVRSSAKADPTNWGCMARGSFMAVAWNSGDAALISEAWDALKRYLEGGSSGFQYKSDQVSWGKWTIAPKGTTKNGVDLDGAIHDIYRGGNFPSVGSSGVSYCWEASQGNITAAIFADMAGHPEVWELGDKAILRSLEWMDRHLKQEAVGDDRWQPWVAKAVYGSGFTGSLITPTTAGKIFAWTDWLYG